MQACSNTSIRTLSRNFARGALNTRPLKPSTRVQQRWASYQRFPNRGGRNSGSSSSGYSNFTPFARAQYIWRSYPGAILFLGVGGGGFYLYNLEEVPITRRRRFNVLGPEREKSFGGDAAYQEIVQQFHGKILPPDHPYTQLVAKIVERLLPSAHGLGGEDWQVHVIDDPNQVNAFVLPGGKVFVFTGIIPIAQDENGLAAVLGHEIAHNVAHHVGEKISRQIITVVAAVLISSLFDVSGQLANGIGDLVLSLPNSRTQEREADHIGLIMMAEACYDPRRAPELWQRMAEKERKQGGAPPQLLSTHPSSGTRGQEMQKWMPEAMEKYDQSECSITARGLNEFKHIADVARRMPGNMTVLTGGKASDNNWPF